MGDTRASRGERGAVRRAAQGGAGLLVVGVWLLAAGLGPAPVAAEEQEPDAVAPAPAVVATATVLEQSGDEWVDGGSEVCMNCHDQQSVLGILKTPHAMKGDHRTPFARHGCETCHGAGSAHSDDPDAPLPVAFGRDRPAGPQNAVCLDCHQGGGRIHWSGSTHESNDVACSACHDVHASQDILMAKDVRPETFVKNNQSEVCYTCHPQVRAQTHRISSHPFKEGRVECSDCHNVHGTVTDALLRQQTLNETCYQCHAEKRGPFLWEHQPAREDCSTCHVPHGSNHRYLLEARTPWLCQSCHDAQFHPGTVYSGTGLPNAAPNRNLLMKNCLNCHYEVHGSNHPSGVRFMR
jgi:DmsE family decaheme c-type cytochrome